MTCMERGRSPLVPIGRAVGAVLAAQLFAAVALASEGGAGGDPWLALLWKAINFLVLAGVIWYFARRPLGTMLRGAAQAELAGLTDPRERARLAEAELSGQRTRIEQLEAELQRLLGEAREEARHEHERMLREARVQAQRIRSAVGLQVEQEFNKARKELQAGLAEQTVRLAEALIRQRMDDAGRTRVVTRAIERLGAGS